MTDLPDDELTWPYVQRYLALRAEKRIGALWPGAAGVYWLAPADAITPFHQVEPIPVPKLRELIDRLDPLPVTADQAAAPAVARKPPQSARIMWLVRRGSYRA